MNILRFNKFELVVFILLNCIELKVPTGVQCYTNQKKIVILNS